MYIQGKSYHFLGKILTQLFILKKKSLIVLTRIAFDSNRVFNTVIIEFSYSRMCWLRRSVAESCSAIYMAMIPRVSKNRYLLYSRHTWLTLCICKSHHDLTTQYQWHYHNSLPSGVSNTTENLSCTLV